MTNPLHWCLSYVLNKFLIERAQNLSPEQIAIDLLHGSVELQGVVFKQTVISFESSPFRLIKGGIKNFRLNIPWSKVFLGSNCVVNLDIDGLFLQLLLVNSTQQSQTRQLEDTKARILQEFQNNLEFKRGLVHKILENLPYSNFMSVERLEFLISRLQVQIKNIQVRVKNELVSKKVKKFCVHERRDIECCYLIMTIQHLILEPTDQNFEPIFDQSSYISNKLDTLRMIGQKFLSTQKVNQQPTLQFKTINISDLNIVIKTQPVQDKKRKSNSINSQNWLHKENSQSKKAFVNECCEVLESVDISIKMRSNNLLYLMNSRSKVYISIDIEIKKLGLNLDEKGILYLQSFVQFIQKNVEEQTRTAKTNWQIAKKKVLAVIRNRSIFLITKKVLWKDIYQKLYKKFYLGIAPQPKRIENQEEKHKLRQKEMKALYEAGKRKLNRENFVEGDSHWRLKELYQIFLPTFQQAIKKKIHQIEIAPKSEIIPAFHFKYSCPTEELEQALMKDLEKHLQVEQIIKYRKQVINVLLYEEFKKSLDQYSSGSFGGIFKYFVRKQDSRKQETIKYKLQMKLSTGGVNLQIRESSLNKISNKKFIKVILSSLELKYCSNSRMPKIELEQQEYYTNFSIEAELGSLQVFNLFSVEKKYKLPENILTIQEGASVFCKFSVLSEMKFKHIQLDQQAQVNINLPLIEIDLIPEFVQNFLQYVQKVSQPPYNGKYSKEIQFLSLMDNAWNKQLVTQSDVKVRYELVLTRVVVNFPARFRKQKLITAEIGRVRGEGDFNTQNIFRFSYIEVSQAQSDNYILKTQVMKVNVSKNRKNRSNRHPLYNKYRHMLITQHPLTVKLDLETLYVSLDYSKLRIIKDVQKQWSSPQTTKSSPPKVLRMALGLQDCKKTTLKTITSIKAKIHLVTVRIVQKFDLSLFLKGVGFNYKKFFFQEFFFLKINQVMSNDNNGPSSEEQILLNISNNKSLKSRCNQQMLDYLGFAKTVPAGFYLFLSRVEKQSYSFMNILQEVQINLGRVHLCLKLQLLQDLIGFFGRLKEPSESLPKPCSEINQDSILIQNKVILYTKKVSVVFYRRETPFYMLCSNKFYSVSDTYCNKYQLRMKLINASLLDITTQSQVHPEFIKPHYKNTLSVNYETKSKQKSPNILQIRFRNCRVCYLNRVVMDIYNYFWVTLMGLLSNPDSGSPKKKTDFSIIVEESQLFIPRNSVIQQGMTLAFPLLRLSNNTKSYFYVHRQFEHQSYLKNKSTDFISIPHFLQRRRSIIDAHSLELSKIIFNSDEKTPVISSSGFNIAHDQLRRRAPLMVEGFEIYYYNPEICLNTQQSSVDFNSIEASSMIDQDQDQKQQALEEKKANRLMQLWNIKLPEPEFSDESIIQEPNIIQTGPKREKYVGFDVLKQPVLVEEQPSFYQTKDVIKLKVQKFQIQAEQDIISKFPLNLSMKISYSEIPYNISLKITSQKKCNLHLYKDKYVLLRSLQENFFELVLGCPPKPLNTSEKTWITVELEIPNISLTLIKESTELLKSRRLSSDKFKLLYRLAKIKFTEFKLAVQMKENSNKFLHFTAKKIQISDKRGFTRLEWLPEIVNPSLIQYQDDSLTDYQCSVKADLKAFKKIEIELNSIFVFVISDLLTEIKEFAMTPFDEQRSPLPYRVFFKDNDNPPSMETIMRLTNIYLVFMTSYNYDENMALYLKIASAVVSEQWERDYYIGPGSLRRNIIANIDKGFIVPIDKNLRHPDTINGHSIMEPLQFQVDLLYQRPAKNANWVSLEMNIRSPQSQEQNWIFDLSFCEIQVIKELINGLSQPSVPDPMSNTTQKSLQRPSAPRHKPPIYIQVVNAYIFGVIVRINNEQIQPVIKINLLQALGAYNKEDKNSIQQGHLIFIASLDSYNQKLMAWEPLVQLTGLEVNTFISPSGSNISLKQYKYDLHINITYSLIEAIGSLVSIFQQGGSNIFKQRVTASPFRFLNHTGFPITIAIEDRSWGQLLVKDIQDDNYVSLKSSELQAYDSRVNSKTAYKYEGKKIKIEINSNSDVFKNKLSSVRYTEINSIGIQTPDTVIYYLKEYSEKELKIHKTRRLDNHDTLKRSLTSYLVEDQEYKQSLQHQKNQKTKKKLFSKCFLKKNKKKYSQTDIEQVKIVNREKEYHKLSLLVVDVQWDQLKARKNILIRSSLTLLNNMSTPLNVIFTKNSSIQDSFKVQRVQPRKKTSVPLYIVSMGELYITPDDLFHPSAVIKQVDSSGLVISTNKLKLSGMKGVVDQKKHSKVIFFNNQTEKQQISILELGFIPLYCQNMESQKHFYCGLSVKKIPNQSYLRNNQSQTTERTDSMIPKQSKIIGYSKTQKNNSKLTNQAECLDLDDQTECWKIIHENHLILNSIISFTNAISMVLQIKATTDLENQEDKEIYKFCQGQTVHLIYQKFFMPFLYISIKLPRYQWSSYVKIDLHDPKLAEEPKKVTVKVKTQKNDSKLFPELRISKDQNNCWRLMLFSHFWIINKTNLNLIYAEPKFIKSKNIIRPIKDEEIRQDHPQRYYGSQPVDQVEEVPRSSRKESIHFKSKLDDSQYYQLRSIPLSDQQEFPPPGFKSDMQSNMGVSQFFSQGKKAGSVYSFLSNSQLTSWDRINIFSPSKRISKLKVALQSVETKLLDSNWSENFTLSNSGTSGNLKIIRHDRAQHDLAVSIQKGLGVFQCTNVITFTPLYILKSVYSRELVVRQMGTEKTIKLQMGVEHHFYWADSTINPQVLSIAADTGSNFPLKWSGGFKIHEFGECVIKLPVSHINHQQQDQYIQVTITNCNPSILVQFIPRTIDPPYRLENYTNFPIMYQQVLRYDYPLPAQKQKELPPAEEGSFTSQVYCWDEQISPHNLRVTIDKIENQYSFQDIKDYTPVRLDDQTWKQAIKRNQIKKGDIKFKRYRWSKSSRGALTLSDKWLLIQTRKKTITIDLNLSCASVIYLTNYRFIVKSCVKTYYFKTDNPEQTLEWITEIGKVMDEEKLSTNKYVFIQVGLDGSTHVMRFKFCNSAMLQKTQEHDKACKKNKLLLEQNLEEEEPCPTRTISLNIQTFGVSFIDDVPQERLLLYLRNLDFLLKEFPENKKSIQLAITDIRVDNQLLETNFPVALTPYFHQKRKKDERSLAFYIDWESSVDIHIIQNAWFLLAPLQIEMDQSLVADLITYSKFVYECFTRKELKQNQVSVYEKADLRNSQTLMKQYSFDPNAIRMKELLSAPIVQFKGKEFTNSSKIFIQELVINPIEFCLTIRTASISSSKKRKNLLQTLAQLGLALTTIQSTEIKLQGYRLINILQPSRQVLYSLFSYYKSQGIRELYKIVGSVQLLGNPAALMNSLKTGFTEMLITPVWTLFKTPKNFGKTLWKGGVGFLQHTVHGVFKSVGTFTGGIGKVFTALTYDNQFKNKMRAMRSRRARNLRQRVQLGMRTLSYGFYKGITGIILQPMRGAKKYGVGGFVKGIAKGIIGTVTMPAAGIIGTVSTAFTSIGDMAKRKHNVRFTDRLRIPAAFYKDKILRAYDLTQAVGQYSLRMYQNNLKCQKILSYVEYYAAKKNKGGICQIFCSFGIFILRMKDYQGVKILTKDIVNQPQLVVDDLTYIKIQSQKKPVVKSKSLFKDCCVSVTQQENLDYLIMVKLMNIPGDMIKEIEEGITRYIGCYQKIKQIRDSQ